MTDKDAFKIGFLLQCADEGLTENQIKARVKRASDLVKIAAGESAAAEAVLPALLSGAGSFLGGVANAGASGFNTIMSNVVSPIINHAMMPALLLPPAVGIGAGYLASRVQDDDYDPKAAQKDEELAEYRRAIDQLKRSRKSQHAG